MDSKKYKSRKDEPVYSSTYSNGGWPERDKLPKSDPIGDIDEIKKDMKKYLETMKQRVIKPEGKNFDLGFEIKPKTCCSKPDKYKNILSVNLKIWSCKNCGAYLGDIK